MKLITLNIWGGKIYDPLIQFLEEQSQDTDIFCFQEVLFGSKETFTLLGKARMNIFSEIEKRFPDFTAVSYYAPEDAVYFENELLPTDTRLGQAIYVRKSLKIIDNGGFQTYQSNYPSGVDFGGKITGNCQWLTIQNVNDGEVTILNVHGLWQKDTHKADTSARIAQSKILHNFLDSNNGKKILCGDFNLKPDGKSMGILEQGMTDLIKKYNITSTRSSFYTKPERFADYILISPDVKLDRFEVLKDEVSDHLPLLLEFE